MWQETSGGTGNGGEGGSSAGDGGEDGGGTGDGGEGAARATATAARVATWVDVTVEQRRARDQQRPRLQMTR